MNKTSFPNYLYELCDSIDAAVFSGDSLYNRESISEFRQLLERWERGLKDIESVIEEMEKDDD